MSYNALISPFRSYVQTSIQSKESYDAARAKGIEFATTKSCLAAVMRIVCDKTINGRWVQKKISHQILIIDVGHSFAIVPYSVAETGFVDLDMDDLKDEEEGFVSRFQKNVISFRGDEWK